MKNYLYSEIAENIANKIRIGVLIAGERLPSIRQLSKQHGVSINTIKRVFIELERQSLIYAKPQSGYFVNSLNHLAIPLPKASQPMSIANSNEPNSLIKNVFSTMGSKELVPLSVGVPSGNLLPLAKLKKEIVLATRTLKEAGTEYDLLAGNYKIRRIIAARSLAWEGHLNEDDLITTHGCMNALALCLMALTEPGDTVALESPCYPGILQLAISLRLKVLEIATHPVTGIDVSALKKLLPKINICLLVPNFNTPLGYCTPDNNKKEIVELLAKHNIPLIEDDTYGDLYFAAKRPKCCKSFDTEGNVLWCGSVSKTLAPGYRVGWVAPGKYKSQILKLKLIHTLSTTAIIHEAVGNFLVTGKYESHLRNLRKILQENHQHYIASITEHFPAGTKISRPQGGLALWVEFPSNIDTISLYNQALKQQISIAPGRMFTLQNQFENCIRLCIGLPWNEQLQQKLKQLGQLAKSTVEEF